jgi:hypothetical protein
VPDVSRGIIASRQKSFGAGAIGGHCTRDVSLWSGGRNPVRFATRRDLPLGSFVLRLYSPARIDDSRVGPLLWLILRRVWPRWRDALVVQRSTADR